MVATAAPDPNGSGPQVTTAGYDLAGNRVSVTDPLGRTTLTGYDAQNRVISQTLPDPDGSSPLAAPVTSYTYTLDGQLASVTDPVGNATTYGYDNAGRKVSTTNQLGYTSYLRYDAKNQVISSTDADGRTRDFAYNALGEMTQEDWVASGSGTGPALVLRTMSWTYDDAGQLIAASDPASSYAYTYDMVGQVTSVDNAGTLNVPNVILNFTYDYAGNRLSLTDNLGSAIAYTYANHRLNSMAWTVDSNAIGQLGFGYDTVGKLTSIVRTNTDEPQILTTYSYDNGDRLTGITNTSQAAGEDPLTLSQFSYSFDAGNQITSYTGPEGTLNYSYDNTGQLTGVSGARTESYSFDINGNRTMAGYTTGSDNRLTSDGTYNYTYDNDGNTLTKTRLSDGQVTTNSWDYRNRLTTIVVKDAAGNVLEEAQYTYDVNDRRIGVWEHVTGQTATQRWTVYDGVNAFADFDGSGSLVTQYLYGPAADQLFARIGASGNMDWYLTDDLGSVRQIVHSNGTVLDNVAYDGFGQILSETRRPMATVSNIRGENGMRCSRNITTARDITGRILGDSKAKIRLASLQETLIFIDMLIIAAPMLLIQAVSKDVHYQFKLSVIYLTQRLRSGGRVTKSFILRMAGLKPKMTFGCTAVLAKAGISILHHRSQACTVLMGASGNSAENTSNFWVVVTFLRRGILCVALGICARHLL